MKILVLEDDAYRIEKFKKLLSNHSVTYTDCVYTAKELVKKESYDVFLLDHDLDLRIFVPSDEENTGYQFAKFLSENKIPGQKIIHSLNPIGSQNMKQVLPEAHVIPYPNLLELLKKDYS